MDMTIELFTVVYVMLGIVLAFPPQELWNIGLTVEGLLGGWLGDEHQEFAQYNMRRIAATVVFHSLLPLGYVAGVQWLYPDVQMAGSPLWTLYTILATAVLGGACLVVWHWYWGVAATSRGPLWSWHPVAHTLQSYAPVLQLPSWKEVAGRLNEEYQDLDKFYSLLTSWNARTLVTRSFIIQISQYRVNVALQEQRLAPANATAEVDGESQWACRLEVSSADEQLSHTAETATAQYLNIKLTNLVTHAPSFMLRINSREFDSFRRAIRVPLHIPAGIVIHRTLAERFGVEFAEQVRRNEPVARANLRGELENCIGCYVQEAQVKLLKRCESAECQGCNCRPMWCVGCMGLWFAHQQDQHHPEDWMAARAPCPSCRSTFCMLDVCAIGD